MSTMTLGYLIIELMPVLCMIIALIAYLPKVILALMQKGNKPQKIALTCAWLGLLLELIIACVAGCSC